VVLIVAVVIAVISGSLTALQTRINSQLALELGDGILSSVISFGSGLAILTIAVLLAPVGRAGLRRLSASVRARRTPWWYLIGGTFGALFVVGQGLTAAVLGVALFTIAVVATQTIAGAVIDRIGVGDLPKRPVTVLRVVASVLALAAVIFSGLAELRADVPIALLILPLLAGVGIGYQQAINGQVRHVSQSALTATFLNFLTGTAVLLIAFVVHTLVVGWVATFPSNPLLYTGGAVGVLFIGGAAAVVRTIGVLLLGLGTIAGQLLGALVLDLVIPISGRGLPLSTVVGTLLTLIAVSLAVVSARRSNAPTPPISEP
jgi:transporter family-2 protein